MQWVKSDVDHQVVKVLAAQWRISTLMAVILVRRAVSESPQELQYFVRHATATQHDPFLLHGTTLALQRVLVAQERRERVLIFGDRDADGITATVVLYKGLRVEGIACRWRVPCGDDPYGLTKAVVDECARERISLIITVDCGIGNHAEIQEANQHGIDTIVIDHHNPSDTMPPAFAVINPKQPNCNYPYKLISGCTLAYKFILALQRRIAGDQRPDHARNELYADLSVFAAISTIADMMPLRNENRIIVDLGLRNIERMKTEGMRALLRKKQLPPTGITASSLAFNIIPLINAAGRFGRADLAVELLATADIRDAEQITDRLAVIHERQKKIMHDAWHSHLERADASHRALRGRGVIVYGDDIPAGVTGLLANKLLREFRSLAVVIATGGDDAIGSVRCDYDQHATEMIMQFSALLSSWGGHDRAAGFTILPGAREQFLVDLQHYLQTVTVRRALEQTIQIDAEIPLPLLNHDLFATNSLLEPFGQAFPPIVYCTRQVTVVDMTLLGKGEQHARLLLNTGSTKIPAVFWNCHRYFGTVLKRDNTIDILYHLEHNYFRHNMEKRLSIIDVALHG